MRGLFAQLLIDCEEDRVFRAVLVGMLRETEGSSGGVSSNLTMSVMPQAQIGVFSGKPSEQEVEAHRRAIEAGGDMRVLGDPKIRTVPNDEYITGPDAPGVCYLVVFQVEAVQTPGK